jgi:2'-5' RNA ligase
VETVRCFIAIELPDAVKAGLRDIQAKLRSGSQAPVKWVDPYGVHLTLKFLGGVDAAKIDPISAAMAEAARGIAPFSLKVEGLGAFPNLRRVQVVWVGLSGEVDKLANLQQRIEDNLAELGFVPEKRRFTPHLTLARVRDQASLAEREGLGQLIAGTGFKASYSFPVAEVSLMRSQLTREGALYSRLGAAALK